MSRKLTPEAIDALKPEGGRRRRLSDGRRLYIVAMPSGVKRWEAEFMDGDRPHRRALGLWPEVSLEEARRRHEDLIARVSAGFSPGRHDAEAPEPRTELRTVGLFAGVGGIEHGLHEGLGASPSILCEIRPEAQAVLRRRFPEAQVVSDVREMEALPEAADLLAAGFPCQDVSIVGPKLGLDGTRSILIGEAFRLLESASRRPELVLFENVPNVITIGNGSFMRFLTDSISALGYRWAYRIIDPRSFGIPHRRPRLFLLAARTLDPATILFPQGEDPAAAVCEAPGEEPTAVAFGFFWTSGKIGIGWSKDSVPPLKAGGLVPSAPAVWAVRQDFIGTPALEDLERLQGLPPGWTDLAGTEFKQATRWGMLGNAVNASVSAWIGRRIRTGGDGGPRPERTRRIYPGSWPTAAFGGASGIWSVEASAYPAGVNYAPILEFLTQPLKALSLKAATGFRRRALESTQVRYPRRFLDSLNRFLRQEHGWTGDRQHAGLGSR